MNGGGFDDEETVWKDTQVPGFESLESVLRCAICQEFLTTPMMFASCAHNFCSLCIRRWLLDKTECPSCRQNQNENNLHYNRELELVVKSFHSERSRLLTLLTGMHSLEAGSQAKIKSSNRKIASNDALKAKETRFEKAESTATFEASIECTSTSNSAHSISKTAPLEMMETGSDRNGLEISAMSRQRVILNPKENIHPVGEVSCSSSKSRIQSQNKITAHSSSSGSGSVPAATSTINVRKRMPKLAYNLFKMSQLKEMVSDLKLPTDGDRNTLTFRHREYTLLYNATVDAENGFEQTQSTSLLTKEIRRRVRENERRVFNGSKSKNQGFIDFKPSGSSYAQTLNGSLSDNLSIDQNFKQLASMIKKRNRNQNQAESRKSSFKKGKRNKKSTLTPSNSTDWRIVLSCRTNHIFYFNSKTKKGQFEQPQVLNNRSNRKAFRLELKPHETISVITPMKTKTINDLEENVSKTWVCTFCTFINESMEDSCEVCLKERPIASRRAKRQRVSETSSI